MRKFPLHFAALALAASLAHADTIIDHANGYTLDAKGQLLRFAALAFNEQGRIIAVGSAAQVAARAPKARHLDAQGKTLLPGLIDAHGHVFGLGQMLSQLDLSATTSLAEALKAATDFARANPGQGWLHGRGWNQENWKLGRFPTAAELDGVALDRPIWFKRVDGHAGWANSRALQLAGISDATPDPVGGKIMRGADGKASGVLVDAAQDLINQVLPPDTEALRRLMLDRALAQIARVGLTSVHDAGLGVAEDRLYRDYADHGKLTARIYGMIGGTERDFEQLAAKGPLLDYADGMYALRAVKLYSDGALGSRGAAMLAPYSDEPAWHGLLFSKDAEIGAMMEKAMRRGYQVNVHAIGDAGNHQIVESFAALIPATASAGARHRIEHAQVVTLADIARFKSIGIIPSMQPTHATSDMNMAEQRIGAQRIEGAYAWRTFLKQGSRIACGSDFPVESPNPFFGIHAAVTRQDSAGQPLAGWHPDQAMTLTEALRCFTLDAAWAGHQERDLGSLEVGKRADFIIIDQDLFQVAPAAIYKTGVLQTWVGGRQVYP
ncbi:MAG: amidohydrolase [Pseudomonadota bacterium]